VFAYQLIDLGGFPFPSPFGRPLSPLLDDRFDLAFPG